MEATHLGMGQSPGSVFDDAVPRLTLPLWPTSPEMPLTHDASGKKLEVDKKPRATAWAVPRRLARLIAAITLLTLATDVVTAQEDGSVDPADGHVALEERLALAEEAVEIADMQKGTPPTASTGSTVDSKYPPCPPSPERGNMTDLEYVLRGFEAAPIFDGPFDYITYW